MVLGSENLSEQTYDSTGLDLVSHKSADFPKLRDHDHHDTRASFDRLYCITPSCTGTDKLTEVLGSCYGTYSSAFVRKVAVPPAIFAKPTAANISPLKNRVIVWLARA
jgi:hypothetical protein